VGAGVVAEIHERHGLGRHGSNAGLEEVAGSGQGQHRPVVARVPMHIEQAWARRACEGGEHFVAAALTHVEHTFEHQSE
jgi:hypothetical protein